MTHKVDLPASSLTLLMPRLHDSVAWSIADLAAHSMSKGLSGAGHARTRLGAVSAAC